MSETNITAKLTDEMIEILDWFAENLPNEYHGYHGNNNLQGETNSEMIIRTIQDLRSENARLRAALGLQEKP